MALPHMSPSLPSALNIRIRAVALSEGRISTSPSPPPEKRRVDRRAARAWGSGRVSAGVVKQSI